MSTANAIATCKRGIEHHLERYHQTRALVIEVGTWLADKERGDLPRLKRVLMMLEMELDYDLWVASELEKECKDLELAEKEKAERENSAGSGSADAGAADAGAADAGTAGQ